MQKTGVKQKQELSSRSADKVFLIMECLAENRLPMRTQEISQQLGMTQPTVLRYLNALIQNGYAYQEEGTLRYGLTMKVCRFGNKMDTNMGIRNITTPFMNILANTLNLGICLVVHCEYQAVYLDIIDDPSTKSDRLLRIGKGAPLYTTSSGKLILNSFSSWHLEDYLSTHKLEKVTDNTICSREALLSELELVKKRGYATDFEECELGIRCAGVPVFNYTDEFAAALTCYGTPDRISNERLKAEILPALNTMAKTISLRMGSNVIPEIMLD